MPGFNLVFDLLDLPMQQLEMIEQSVNQQPESAGQFIAGILDQLRHSAGNVSDALRHDQTVFTEQAANLVGLRSARFTQKSEI